MGIWIMSALGWYFKELIVFTVKQARACIFAGSFFVVLIASN